MPFNYQTPSPEELGKLVKGLESLYGNTHNNMRYWDRLYNREYAGLVKAPEGVDLHRSSRAMRMVDNLRDQVRTDKPVVEALLEGTSEKARRKRDLQQMWGRGELVRVGQEGMADPWVQADGDLLLRGAACVKWAVREESLLMLTKQEGEGQGEFERRKKRWDQDTQVRGHFVVRAVDPLLVFPSPGVGPLRYMVEKQRRRVLDVEEKYGGLWSDPKGRTLSKTRRDDPLREVEWVSYWSWIFDVGRQEWGGSYIVDIDGERVYEDPNPCHQVPYSYRYSGLGRVNEDGDPAKLAVGVLSGVSGEIEGEVAMKTALLAQSMFSVFPRLWVKGESAKEIAKAMRVGPGAVIELPNTPGSEMRWLEVAPLNPQTLEFLNRMEEAISRLDNPALGGMGTASAGIHEALNIGQAMKVSVGRVKDSLEVMAGQALEGMAALQSLYGLDSSVHGTFPGGEESRNIKAEELRGVKFRVSFEAVDPAENDRRMLAMLGVKREPGTLSRRTFREVALRGTVQSSEEEEVEILAEQMVDAFMASGAWIPQLQQALQQNQQKQGAIEAAKGVASNLQQAVGQVAQQGVVGQAPVGMGQAADQATQFAAQRALGRQAVAQMTPGQMAGRAAGMMGIVPPQSTQQGEQTAKGVMAGA